MGAIKNWMMDAVYELNKEGFSIKEISEIIGCEIEFVEAIVGAD